MRGRARAGWGEPSRCSSGRTVATGSAVSRAFRRQQTSDTGVRLTPASRTIHGMATTPRAGDAAAGHEGWREAYEAGAERDVPFTTLSGLPIEPLYTESDLPDAEQIGVPGAPPFTRGVYPSMYRGRLWTMRQFAGFGTAEETNERFRYLLDHGQTGLSTAFDMPSLMGHDSDHPRSLGEVGREGVAVDTLDDMQTLFQGIDLGDVSVSMTINAPAAIMLAYYVVAAEEQGVPAHRARRHDPGRHPQGVHRPEGVVLPDRPGDAPAGRHDRVVLERDAALASGLDLRVPHPRGRLDGRPGARVHAQGRPDVRRAGRRARPRRRRLRAPAELLLQRPDRLLRGDLQVPRGAPHLGARAARDVRREGPALLADALPHADRRRQPDRAAAAQQHHAHGDRGARRRARRDAVAAHQQLRRGARAADRGRGADRAAGRSRSSPTRPAWRTRSTRWAAATSWRR